MRLLVLLFSLAVLMLPATASASGTGTVAVTGITGGPNLYTVTFSATVTNTCPPPTEWGPSYCGWFTKLTTVPAGQVCSDFGTHVWVGPLEDGAVTRTYADDYLALAPADEVACLYMYENGAYTLVAQTPYHVGPNAPPPSAPTPAPAWDPIAGLSTEPIPYWVASRRRDEAFIISTASIPSDVHRDRFIAIARNAAMRWDLADYGTTRRRLKLANWENELGFIWNLPYGVLGRQTDMVVVRYRPRRHVCRSGRCWWRKRKVISRELVDRDVAINARPALAQGPERPTAGQIDLETVVLHELGHLAGNKHARDCRNTPMVKSITSGEWWRATTDYQWLGCGQATSARSRLSGMFQHVRRTMPVLIGTAGDRTLQAHSSAHARVRRTAR